MPFCRNHPEVIQVGLGKSGTSTVQKYFTDRFGYNATCGALLPNGLQCKQNCAGAHDCDSF